MGNTLTPKQLQSLVETLDREARASDQWGNVASYIPELACIDPQQFAISICTCDGREYHAGDAHTGFSIQSVSKVFTLALALGRLGAGLWERVGGSPPGVPSTPSSSWRWKTASRATRSSMPVPSSPPTQCSGAMRLETPPGRDSALSARSLRRR